MVLTRTSTVMGVFEDQAHAVNAIRALRENGFPEQEIGLVAREWVEGAPAPISVKAQHRGGRAAVGGAAAGAGLGAVLGLGATLIPGLGLVAAGGLLLSALTGAALGAAAGAFLAPFLALEISEPEAREYAAHVEKGRTVVLVGTPTRQEEAEEIFRQHGAYDDSVGNTPT